VVVRLPGSVGNRQGTSLPNFSVPREQVQNSGFFNSL
jgi:hypothetical protein